MDGQLTPHENALTSTFARPGSDVFPLRPRGVQGCKGFFLPFAAWALSVLWRLDHNVSVGMIIMASVPSSPISNLWQWLSCAHIGLGAFLTFASNFCSMLSTQLILRLCLGSIVNESFSLDALSIFVYTCAYSVPIVLASTVCYFFLPADKEVHWKWKVLALTLLVTSSLLAFFFVGNSPLGITIDPAELFYNRKAKVKDSFALPSHPLLTSHVPSPPFVQRRTH